MKPILLLLGVMALTWNTGGHAFAETVSIPVVPASLWKGGGQDVDVSATRAEAADDPDAVLFRYALLGGQSPYGYAEYIYQGPVSFAGLPKRVRVDLEGEAAEAMVMIRFVDAEGTFFQWNVGKVDFTDWQPIERELHPGRGGYGVFGPKVKPSEGTASPSKAFPLTAPFKLYSILLNRRFQGDDEHRSFSLRHLEIEY